MSGHDIAAKPHQTTHEMRDAVVFGAPVRWTAWPNVKPRNTAQPERRAEPRPSRFGDLHHG